MAPAQIWLHEAIAERDRILADRGPDGSLSGGATDRQELRHAQGSSGNMDPVAADLHLDVHPRKVCGLEVTAHDVCCCLFPAGNGDAFPI